MEKLFLVSFYPVDSNKLWSAVVKATDEFDARQNLIAKGFDDIASTVEIEFDKFNVCIL